MRTSTKTWVPLHVILGSLVYVAAAAVLTVLCEGCIKEFSVVVLSGVLLGEATREHEVSKDAALQGEEEMRD